MRQNDGLEAISEHLATLSPEDLDHLRDKLSIAIQRDVEVADLDGGIGPLVSQAFCSYPRPT